MATKVNIKGDLQINGLEVTNQDSWLSANDIKCNQLKAGIYLEVKGRAIFIQGGIAPEAKHVGDIWIETPI